VFSSQEQKAFAGSPVIFPLPDHSALLASKRTGERRPVLGASTVDRFPNGELHARLDTPVQDRDCVVLGSLAPPDERLLSLLLLAHTLRRAGARRVIALLPYLGYARQDRGEHCHSLGVEWAGDLLQAAGVERAVTVDVHSARAAACFPMPLRSLSPAPLFAADLVRGGLSELSVVAPDQGARPRCEAVIRAAGIRAPLAHLRKRRDADGVRHSALVGEVGPRAAIVDDILDTGGTLISACAELRRAGVREISVLVTHALLTGERWRELPALGVRRIVATDSVPLTAERGGGLVQVLPITPLLLDTLSGPAHISEAG